MARRNITDESGEFLGWFEEDSATSFHEDTYWDGHNHISKATRSQWTHETLHLTAKGRWVLENTGGYRTSYTAISENQAAEWLAINDLDDDKRIPPRVVQIMDSKEM